MGENIEERYWENISRYEGLVKKCVNAGWKVHLFAIEVGTRNHDQIMFVETRIYPTVSMRYKQKANDTALM